MKNFVLVAAVALAAALALGTAAGSRVPKAPDLVDASIGKAPAHAAPGLRFTLMNVVANRGGARARPSVTRFSLRSGKTSRLAGLRRTPALKPHESVRSRVRLQVPATAPAASYALIACVDATHAVKEADERDNCRTARARLQVQPPVAPQPAPAPTPSPGATDSDRDGTPDTADCAPQDASIHPGATDTPDLKVVDSNCDGIDGDAAKSIFVAPGGKDTNPGTRSQPKGTVAGAIVTAAKSGSAVLVAAGTYSEGGGVELLDNVGIYGGYAPSNWSRSNANATMIVGSPQAVFADGVRGATLQLLTLRSGTAGQSPGASTYAVRAINRSKLTIEQSNLQSSDGFAGAAGLDGAAGENGATGRAGGDGDDDHIVGVPGGPGGPSSIGATGGQGGHGGRQVEDGETGLRGAGPSGGAGGAGGEWGDPGEDGRPGSPGGDGPRVGVPGAGGVRGVDLAGATWRGHDGADGTAGEPGSGGGGGGGGGGQHCILCTDGTGSGGGGGGAGGLGGSGGSGGHAGGGSFGVYLRDSEVHLTAGTTIRTGTGGAGGAGGRAGTGGFGGPGGPGGGKSITSGEIGRGGDGGRGGFGTHGGAGGGGAGGPSIGVFKVGASQADIDPGASIVPGPGGGGGNGGTPGGIDGRGGYSAGVYAAS